MIDVDVLRTTVWNLKPGDSFYNKGQSHTVQRVEPLTEFLVRVHTNVMGFNTELLLDSRLVLKAVYRTVITNTED